MGPVGPSVSGIPDWPRTLTARLITSALAMLEDPDAQSRYGEEWASDLAQIGGRWGHLRHSVSVRLAAPRIADALQRPTQKKS